MYDYEIEEEVFSVGYCMVLIFFFIEIISNGIMLFFDVVYIWPLAIVFVNLFFVFLAIKVKIDMEHPNKRKSFILITIILFFTANMLFFAYQVSVDKFWGKERQLKVSPQKTNMLIIEKDEILIGKKINIYKRKWFLYMKMEEDSFGDYVSVRWIDENRAYIIIDGARSLIKFQ